MQARVPDKFEAQPVAFFEQVRNGYARRCAQYPARFAQINANQAREAVWLEVETAVLNLLAAWQVQGLSS